MPPDYLRPDEGLHAQLLEELVALVPAPSPNLPDPGPQMAWYEAMNGTDPPRNVEMQASLALRRLLDLGATTEDLYAAARGITALVLMDAVEILHDDDGETAGEFYYLYDQLEYPETPDSKAAE